MNVSTCNSFVCSWLLLTVLCLSFPPLCAPQVALIDVPYAMASTLLPTLRESNQMQGGLFVLAASPGLVNEVIALDPSCPATDVSLSEACAVSGPVMNACTHGLQQRSLPHCLGRLSVPLHADLIAAPVSPEAHNSCHH